MAAAYLAGGPGSCIHKYEPGSRCQSLLLWSPLPTRQAWIAAYIKQKQKLQCYTYFKAASFACQLVSNLCLGMAEGKARLKYQHRSSWNVTTWNAAWLEFPPLAGHENRFRHKDPDSADYPSGWIVDSNHKFIFASTTLRASDNTISIVLFHLHFVR